MTSIVAFDLSWFKGKPAWGDETCLLGLEPNRWTCACVLTRFFRLLNNATHEMNRSNGAMESNGAGDSLVANVEFEGSQTRSLPNWSVWYGG